MPRNAPYGYQRSAVNLTVPAGALNSTATVPLVTDLPLGFAYEIEKAWIVATTAWVAGSTRTVNIKRGSTVVATKAANTGGTLQGAAGTFDEVPLVAGVDPAFADTDKLTVELAGGTAVTAGTADLHISIRQRPQRKA